MACPCSAAARSAPGPGPGGSGGRVVPVARYAGRCRGVLVVQRAVDRRPAKVLVRVDRIGRVPGRQRKIERRANVARGIFVHSRVCPQAPPKAVFHLIRISRRGGEGCLAGSVQYSPLCPAPRHGASGCARGPPHPSTPLPCGTAQGLAGQASRGPPDPFLSDAVRSLVPAHRRPTRGLTGRAVTLNNGGRWRQRS